MLNFYLASSPEEGIYAAESAAFLTGQELQDDEEIIEFMGDKKIAMKTSLLAGNMFFSGDDDGDYEDEEGFPSF